MKEENTRINKQHKDEWYGYSYRCVKCECEWMSDLDNGYKFCPSCGRKITVKK